MVGQSGQSVVFRVNVSGGRELRFGAGFLEFEN
jgi:hypothetical protein